jgi:hypothetical protein
MRELSAREMPPTHDGNSHESGLCWNRWDLIPTACNRTVLEFDSGEPTWMCDKATSQIAASAVSDAYTAPSAQAVSFLDRIDRLC